MEDIELSLADIDFDEVIEQLEGDTSIEAATESACENVSKLCLALFLDLYRHFIGR